MPDLDWKAIDRETEAAERALAERAGGVKVKALQWEEIHQRRSDEDPITEVVGFEANNGFDGWYNIETRAADFRLDYPDNRERPDCFETEREAKASAQADYERRILSALSPAAEPAAPHPLAKHLPDHETLRGQIEGDPDDAYEGAGAARPEGRQDAVTWRDFIALRISALEEGSRSAKKDFAIEELAFVLKHAPLTRPAEQAEPVSVSANDGAHVFWLNTHTQLPLSDEDALEEETRDSLRLAEMIASAMNAYTSQPDQSADLAAALVEVAEVKSLLAEVENFARAAATWRGVPPSIADAARALLEKMRRP